MTPEQREQPGRFCAVCWKLESDPDQQPCRYEHWEDALRRKPIAHSFVHETVSHSDHIIVVKPESTLALDWRKDGREWILTRGPWSAVVTPCYLDENQTGVRHNVEDPNCWKAEVGGYLVSNQPVISRNGGCSKTYIIYLSDESQPDGGFGMALACGQRALALWGPEWNAKQERERANAIERLDAHNQALRDENERLLMRLQGALERLSEART